MDIITRPVNPEPERLCVSCDYWDFDPGESDYSSLTPGSDWEMVCYRNIQPTLYGGDLRRASVRHSMDPAVDYRAWLLRAETCPDFTPRRKDRP